MAGPFSLRGLVEVFFRRKVTFIIPIILVPLLSVALSYMVPERYMSTTTIMVDRSGILNPLVRFETAVSLQDWNAITTLRKIIYSRPVVEKLIEELDLEPADATAREHEWLIDEIRSNIHILSQESDSFQIGCSAADPGTAQQMAQKISTFFIEQTLEGSRREANAAVDFIQEQLTSYDEQLEAAKEKLKEFRLANLDRIRRQNAIQADIDRYEKRILDTEIELREATFQRSLLQKRLNQEEPMVVAEQLFNDNTPYRRRYRELRLERARLLSSRSEDHPEVRKLERELATIRELIQEEKSKEEASQERVVKSPVYQKTRAKLQEVGVEIETLDYELEGYRKKLAELRERRAEMPELQNRHDRLRSEVENLRETHESLRTKLQQARISRAVELEQQQNRFRVINPPLVPLSRYTPIRKNYAVGGVATGIMLGFVLIIGLEIVEPRLCRPDELSRSTSLPLWSSIPVFHEHRGRLHERVPGLSHLVRLFRKVVGPRRITLPQSVSDDWYIGRFCRGGTELDEMPTGAREGVEEGLKQFRAISAALQELADGREKGLATAVTSARRGEGRTMLVANLAAVLTEETDRRVLMVDADGRRGDLSRRFAPPDAPGLGEALEGNRPLSECIHPTDHPRLDVLPAGAHPGETGHLHAGHRLPELLGGLREDYSSVVLDLPPVTVSPRTRRVCAVADVNLLVTRLYTTPRGVATAAAQSLPRNVVKAAVGNCRRYWIPDWMLRWM